MGGHYDADPNKGMIEPVLVVGPGRSGTSAVAGLLHEMGYFMGERFTEKGAQPKGYFEDMDLTDVHTKHVSVNSKSFLESQEFFEDVDPILARYEALEWPWALKETRMAHFLGFYLKRYPNAKIISCERDLRETVRSIIQTQQDHEYVSEEQVKMEIEGAFYNRVRLIEQGLRNRDHLKVDFFDLVAKRTDDVIEEIIDYLEVPMSLRKRQHLHEWIVRR